MSGRLKIAVADDEIDTREYLQIFLTHLGHDVRVAENGQRLVELCREFSPDLVVTDFAMPGLNGLAAAEQVHRERPVPVIVLSGRDDVESQAAVETRVIAFLSKPVKPVHLQEAIELVNAEALSPKKDGPAAPP